MMGFGTVSETGLEGPLLQVSGEEERFVGPVEWVKCLSGIGPKLTRYGLTVLPGLLKPNEAHLKYLRGARLDGPCR